jgi:hypothetical protein
MQRRHLAPVLASVAVLLTAAGCSNVQEQLGLTTDPPDEFRVVARAPLAIPPDFTLRPPRPGLQRPQEGTATQQARTAVFRVTDDEPETLDEAIPADGRTVGERALLMAAGANQTEPNIRNIVDTESQNLDSEDSYLYDVLVFWRDDAPPGEVIDAEAEAKRLQENAALGLPANEGETPTIERKKKALLEGIF